ncbi:helix-turn-helix domain-containing protein [Nocardia sp. NPDC050712]|uniref:helix-turn-helix domain-containing protein n=1 Tax=Nocardia sp. NPDC050712 TaxID=3155518 RepID=UPI0033D3ABB7
MASSALSGTCPPPQPLVVWLRMGHVVSLGPSMELDTHSSALACLGVGVQGPFTVRSDGHPDVTARSFLFRARKPHNIVRSAGRLLFCYFDPTSAAMTRSLGGMLRTVHGCAVDHHREAELIALCEHPHLGVENVLELASIPAAAPRDIRIAKAASVIRADPAAAHRAAKLAAEVGLSQSYFLRQFSEQTGTSFRRYIQWARILRAAQGHISGHDATRCAADAGFATPSHFTDTFHRMFGFTPTALVRAGAQIHVEPREVQQGIRACS